jgi:hypothetical protein
VSSKIKQLAARLTLPATNPPPPELEKFCKLIESLSSEQRHYRALAAHLLHGIATHLVQPRWRTWRTWRGNLIKCRIPNGEWRMAKEETWKLHGELNRQGPKKKPRVPENVGGVDRQHV